MKMTLLIAIALFAVNPLLAGGKASCEQRRKQENAKCSAKYAERAKKCIDSKLSECYVKASPEVRKAAGEEVELKKKLGGVYQRLSEAYKNGDKAVVKKLYGEKCEIERSMDVARRKTKIARYISEADDKIAKCPDSSDLKELKADLDRLCDEYLAVSKEINKKIQERSEIEKSMRRRRDELYEKFRAEKKKNGCSFRKKKKSKKCK